MSLTVIINYMIPFPIECSFHLSYTFHILPTSDLFHQHMYWHHEGRGFIDGMQSQSTPSNKGHSFNLERRLIVVIFEEVHIISCIF